MDKRFASVLLVLICILSLCFLPENVLAKNNTFDQAEDITEKDVAEGKNEKAGDDHYYKFEADKNGYMTIDFDHEKGKGAHEIRVYNSAKEEIFFVACEKDQANYTSQKFSINAGINYIKIHSKDNRKDYSLSVRNQESDRWETEPNDETGKAYKVSPDQIYFGTNVGAKDLDYYTFDVTEDGKLIVHFSQKDELGPHTITVFDGNQKELGKYTVTESEKKAGKKSTSTEASTVSAANDKTGAADQSGQTAAEKKTGKEAAEATTEEESWEVVVDKAEIEDEGNAFMSEKIPVKKGKYYLLVQSEKNLDYYSFMVEMSAPSEEASTEAK